MQVNRQEWHTRLYLWWYAHKYRDGEYPSDKTTTNLCPYMRVVMFWAPLRAIFWNWVRVYKGIPLNMITIPVLMYIVPLLLGFWSYRLKFILWNIFGGASVAAVVVISLVFLCMYMEDRRKERWLRKGSVPRVTKPLKPWVESTLKFLAMIGDLLQSGHDRICPEIDITDEE